MSWVCNKYQSLWYDYQIIQNTRWHKCHILFLTFNLTWTDTNSCQDLLLLALSVPFITYNPSQCLSFSWYLNSFNFNISIQLPWVILFQPPLQLLSVAQPLTSAITVIQGHFKSSEGLAYMLKTMTEFQAVCFKCKFSSEKLAVFMLKI